MRKLKSARSIESKEPSSDKLKKPETLKQIRARFIKFEHPEQLFGNDLGSDPEAQKKMLKEAFNFLIKQFHPDRYQNDPKNFPLVNDIARVIHQLRARADRKIENGTYGKAIDPDAKPQKEICIIGTSRRDYRIISLLVEGQYTEVYLGEYDDPENIVESIRPVVFKITSDKSNNHLLDKEIDVLDSLHHHSLPVLVDHLTMPANHSDAGKKATFLRHIKGLDLYEVREKYPSGLETFHVCWIMERILGALSYLHSNLCIHGYITPDNILVWSEIHNAFLLDFSHSLFEPRPQDRLKIIRPEFTAPEILAGKKPHPAADLYMLGKCMAFLLGAEEGTDRIPQTVDPRIRDFVSDFLVESPIDRMHDAGDAYHELSDLRLEVFGARHDHTKELILY